MSSSLYYFKEYSERDAMCLYRGATCGVEEITSGITVLTMRIDFVMSVSMLI